MGELADPGCARSDRVVVYGGASGRIEKDGGRTDLEFVRANRNEIGNAGRQEVCYLIPDVLWPWIAPPIVVGCVCLFWRDVLEAHIKERTLPAAKTMISSRSRRSPAVISGRPFQGNGFHSAHWGEPVPNTQVQVLSGERRDREGYSRQSQTHQESPLWEVEAVWPTE